MLEKSGPQRDGGPPIEHHWGRWCLKPPQAVVIKTDRYGLRIRLRVNGRDNRLVIKMRLKEMCTLCLILISINLSAIHADSPNSERQAAIEPPTCCLGPRVAAVGWQPRRDSCAHSDSFGVIRLQGRVVEVGLAVRNVVGHCLAAGGGGRRGLAVSCRFHVWWQESWGGNTAQRHVGGTVGPVINPTG